MALVKESKNLSILEIEQQSEFAAADFEVSLLEDWLACLWLLLVRGGALLGLRVAEEI